MVSEHSAVGTKGTPFPTQHNLWLTAFLT